MCYNKNIKRGEGDSDMKSPLTAFGANFGKPENTDQTIAPEYQAILDRCDARRAAREAAAQTATTATTTEAN